MFNQIERRSPFISVNKLSEYVKANVLTRRSIIEDQKYPKPYKQLLYRECFGAIQSFLSDPVRNIEVIHNAMDLIRAIPVQTSKQDEQRLLKLEALQHVLNARDKFSVPWSFQAVQLNGVASLKIAGVDVSIRPELQITAVDNNGRFQLGFLKLCLSKTHGLDKERAAYLGTLVHQYACETLGENKVDRNKVLVFDVFAETLYVAPANYRQRRKELAVACLEIYSLWNSPMMSRDS
jgi:hypothetical protein